MIPTQFVGANHPLPVWRRLHVRAALLAAPLLMLLGGCMVFLLQHYSAQTALEAGQRMNLGLAQYVVEHQEPGLLDARGIPDSARVQELAMSVMKINPAVEVYFLNREGRVMAHALDGLKGIDPVGSLVDMQPVTEMLRHTTIQIDGKGGNKNGNGSNSLRLPLLGSDPIQPGLLNSFSVYPLMSASGATDGYLYVVLNGRMVQSGRAQWANSQALQAMVLAVVAVTALVALVLWLVLRHLTQPLRQLTDELRTFRSGESPSSEATSGDEVGVLRASMKAMQSRIAQQFQSLEDGDRQRRELVSNISHDLRTPLSNIRGYVETVMLRGDAIDAHARAAHLRTAMRHVDLLGKRIGDLFELSKLDAGRVTPRQEVFCLAELLQDVVQNYQLAAQKRGVTMQLSAGSHAKAKVVADIAMIERVLQNLIDNALRHSSEGGVVTLAIEMQGDFAEISVSDTGRGIPSEDLPHIFERYWRASDASASASANSRTNTNAPSHESNTSSGLGLAIVKRILDLHGSAVHVHSEFQRGTRFGFMLPHQA